jgi:multidrug efflux pump
MLARHSDIRDLDDGLPLPGIDWKVHVDQAEAAKFAANPAIVGTALQLVTNGIKATEFRPAGSDKAVDILVRFPEDRRSLDQMDELRVQTPSGSVQSAISERVRRRASGSSTASRATAS